MTIPGHSDSNFLPKILFAETYRVPQKTEPGVVTPFTLPLSAPLADSIQFGHADSPDKTPFGNPLFVTEDQVSKLI